MAVEASKPFSRFKTSGEISRPALRKSAVAVAQPSAAARAAIMPSRDKHSPCAINAQLAGKGQIRIKPAVFRRLSQHLEGSAQA